MTIDRDGIVYQLRQSLCALALDGRVALATLPGNCVKADELALDYSESFAAIRSNDGFDFLDSQLAALARVDGLLDDMSGQEQPHLWTNDAVITHPRWAEVRQAARDALALLRWDCSADTPLQADGGFASAVERQTRPLGRPQ